MLRILLISIFLVLPLVSINCSHLFILKETSFFTLQKDSSIYRKYSTARPSNRAFTSSAIEHCIDSVTHLLTNEKLVWMFSNCFPNTLDTTVKYRCLQNGDDDTFIITGDIPAMWLRDSGAQVWPYLRFVKKDLALRHLVRGVIRRQLRCILIDPYANAFTECPDSISPKWSNDYTEMRPGVFERKYELDSQCYPIRLAHAYWKETQDSSVFDSLWINAIETILKTMRKQQCKEGDNEYKFQRTTHAMHDTQSNYGLGHPARPCGMIAQAFRPSDDCTIFPYNIPGNIMAGHSLAHAAEILEKVNVNYKLARECRQLSEEIKKGVETFGIVSHPHYGNIYAYEVDGYGGVLLMDDANIPSLLSLPYISDVAISDSIYQNTRRFVWSTDNPYFFSGRAGEGIGGPHVGMHYIWPMSLIMRALTSTDDKELIICLQSLLHTDGDTGFIHEAFHKDDSRRFTRSWFAWGNTLFGELILKLIDEGKLNLLNSSIVETK